MSPAADVFPEGKAPAHPLYPYSVIPYGVYSAKGLLSASESDRVIAAHYSGFDIRNATTLTLRAEKWAYVSFRLRDAVYWTKRKVRLRAGETLITDGLNFARTRCGNRLSDTPRQPTTPEEPAQHVLNTPAEANGPVAFEPGASESVPAGAAAPNPAGSASPAPAGANAAPPPGLHAHVFPTDGLFLPNLPMFSPLAQSGAGSEAPVFHGTPPPASTLFPVVPMVSPNYETGLLLYVQPPEVHEYIVVNPPSPGSWPEPTPGYPSGNIEIAETRILQPQVVPQSSPFILPENGESNPPEFHGTPGDTQPLVPPTNPPEAPQFYPAVSPSGDVDEQLEPIQVPEPATAMLLAAALGSIWLRRRS
ncbi:MAG: PEP-CTERM sorting domain-containing protein [Acidobacteria bacterium]|nr:PEP-CTERM sorting domain-containing protein [Acidobacteriota bacterium]